MNLDNICGITEGKENMKLPVRAFNKKILRQIIEDSFHAQLNEEYMPFLIENDAIAYMDLQYRGVAIVLPHPAGGVLPHLKTLAVLPEHQGNHIGKALMYSVSEGYRRKLNWRSKPDRKANKLYNELAGKGKLFTNVEGIPYFGYFINHTTKEKRAALDYMAKQPDSFEKAEIPTPQPLLTS